ncbi:MAG: NAD-dependent protein deacetylase [Sciscionella sp.]|nr:NAD-dependent protein deacetylase [Sciscionella sp.]
MRIRPTLSWTTVASPLPATGSVADVADVLAGRRSVVLSGAGLSTESGIPDYRGTNGRLRRHQPMTYQEFVGSAQARRRYWARSHLGWSAIASAAPNRGHFAVTALCASGTVCGVITQNVDGLHHAAGTREVIELHGSLHRVRCLSCGSCTGRDALTARLRSANPDFDTTASVLNPDGDAELPDDVVRTFRVVGCVDCAGVLKPDVVFFGESVPQARTRECHRMIDDADALLVLGSSLAVMSGLRLVRRANAAGKPVCVINQGPTRGDPHAKVRVDRRLGDALPELVTALSS